jgi:hypothetical protein
MTSLEAVRQVLEVLHRDAIKISRYVFSLRTENRYVAKNVQRV